MAVKVAGTIESMNPDAFPAVMASGINLIKDDGSEKSLQKMYDDNELGGSGLPEPESKDKLLVSVENEETSELEWSQVDKGTIDGSAYVNLDVGSDLNTLITHGRFRTTTKRVDRIANVPVQVAGMLTVRLTGSVIYQTYNSIDNKMYTRTSEDAGENWSDWKDVSVGDSAFKGTHDEWKALTDEEKARYETVIFTDDYDKPNMKFPDYAHRLTMTGRTWVATQDVFINVLQVNNAVTEALYIDGIQMSVPDSTNGVFVYAWSGYAKKGQTISYTLLDTPSRCHIYPLV